MAGVITFSIDGTSSGFVNASGQALGEMRKFRISVDDINAAFDRANAKGMKAAGPSAAEFKSAARAINSSIAGIAMTAGMFAGPTATALIYPVVLFSKELKTLSATMKALHITAGAAGGAVAGAVAILATWTSAYQYAQAAQAETKSGTTLWEQNTKDIAKLLEMLTVARNRGQLGQDDWLGMSVQLALANKLEDQVKAIGRARAALGNINAEGRRTSAKSAIDEDLSDFTKRNTLQGAALQKYIFGRESIQFLRSQLETANAAGLSQDDQDKIIDRVAEVERQVRARIDAEGKPETRSISSRPQVTEWERMGFMFNGRGGGFDYARSTADNTRQLVKEVQTTNKLLSTTPAAGNSFANQ